MSQMEVTGGDEAIAIPTTPVYSSSLDESESVSNLELATHSTRLLRDLYLE
jgi:hypothetical protein